MSSGISSQNETAVLPKQTIELHTVNNPLSTGSNTYKRDVLKNDTDADRRIIASGSASAHGGDAVADALLYSTNRAQEAIIPYIKSYTA